MLARALLAAAWVAAGWVAGSPAAAQVAEPLAATLPMARWQAPGLDVEVGMADRAAVAADTLPALMLYAIGVVALPVAAVHSPALLAWPVFMLIAPPFQASFNAQSEILGRALADTPLPSRVVGAIAAQWTAADAGIPPWRVRLTLAAYGLSTRSGLRREAFEPSEDLCLAADAQMDWERDGALPRREVLTVGHATRSADAPPPLCTSMGRLAADDGRLLRQAIEELAEVLAAMVLGRLQAAR
jgi:hypothetical protein